jgi:hypothetical protein
LCRPNYTRKSEIAFDFLPASDRLLVMTAHLEPGDLFLWDDRTLHCNASGHPGYPTPPDSLSRAAVLVCMAPRGWGGTDPKVTQAARRYALELGVDGGHDTTCSLRSMAAVDERKREVEEQDSWAIDGLDGERRRVPQAVLTEYQMAIAGV